MGLQPEQYDTNYTRALKSPSTVKKWADRCSDEFRKLAGGDIDRLKDIIEHYESELYLPEHECAYKMLRENYQDNDVFDDLLIAVCKAVSELIAERENGLRYRAYKFDGK